MNTSHAGFDQKEKRRARAALALATVLALLMLGLGIHGIRQHQASGYDDAAGFAYIRKASRETADTGEKVQLQPFQQEALALLLDSQLAERWRELRFRGETIRDFERADSALRAQTLQSLLREEDSLKLGGAASALLLMDDQMDQDGVPAVERLILRVADLLPEAQGKDLRASLNAVKTEQSVAVEEMALAEGRALLGEAVAERRLSRYLHGGQDLLLLTRALAELLMDASPGEDWAPFLELLRQVPRDAAAYEDLFALPAEEAMSAVLAGIDPGAMSGARLIALNRALYERLLEAAPQALDDHQAQLLNLIADSMEAEYAQELRLKTDLLQARAWNQRLLPLLGEAATSARTGDAELSQVLSALAQGQPVPQLENDLAARLILQRDSDTDRRISQYLADLPMDNALVTKARLLFALDAFLQRPAPETSLSGEEAALLLLDLDKATEAADQLPQLLQALGLAVPPQEQTALGLRLAIRQNAPRVSASLAIARGGGGFLQSLIASQGKQLALLGAVLLIDVLLLYFFMRQSREWRLDIKWLLVLLIVDFLLVVQVLPLLFLLYRALTPSGSLSFVTFGRLFSYNMNRSALYNTIVGGLSAMVLGTLLAFPLAWLVGRTNLYGKKFFRSLFVLTYMVPPYVGAMAWLRLLNPNVGTINQFLRGFFGLGSTAGPINIYSLGGLVWVLTTFYYPYAFITISRAMEKMDPSLEEASRVSGASPFITLIKVTLPIMTPSLIAGALLVFVSAASCYGIPSIIGAPGRVHTVTTRIIEYYGRGTQGLNDATGLAVFLMVMAILILYLSDFVVARKQYITVSGKSTRPNIVDLRSWRLPLTILVILFALFIVILPFFTILTTSLKIDVGKSVLEAGNFTLNQWTTIFSRSETIDSLKNSLIFATVAATVGILVAITMSYLMQRTRIRGRKLPDFLITLGSGSPSVVIALGLIMTMQGRFGINIYNTAYIIIVAYLIKYMMMGMRTVTSAISQIHVSLEESSQVSGASWLTTMRRITGPLIFPSIAAGWFLIFIPCFYELSMTTLLYSNTTKTIGFQLYEYWTYTSQPQASALAFGILLIVILINQLLSRLTRGSFTI
jgi:iron(III) transport system permease protein